MYYDPQTNQPRRSKVYLVCGAPASGKTTYVKQHKEPGDFVLDLDVLRQALGAPAKISDCFQPQVMAIRDVLYQHIVFNKIGAKTIWVIAGLPERQRRLDMARYLKAELIYMQTPKEECLKRAMNDPERQDKEQQRKIIEGYFRVLS